MSKPRGDVEISNYMVGLIQSKHNYKIWLNDGVYQQWEETTCFDLQRPSSGFDNFLFKKVLYNMPKPCGDVEIS